MSEASTAATNQNRNTAKRSLSESSADEYHKSDCTADRNGSQQRKMWRNEMVISPDSPIVQPQRKYSGGGGGAVVCGRAGRALRISDAIDVAIRAVLVVVFIQLERTQSFKRKIHMEEMWLYKNPRTPDIVTPAALMLTVIFGPFCVTLLHWLLTRDGRDFRAASWVWTLSLCMNGLATSLLKITVGRPRPDFFYRCFPDGVMVLNNVTDAMPTVDLFNCTGNPRDINEGHKSFPSGHASFAFVAFGFLSFYVGAKLHAFSARGRGQTWRLCIAITPLIIATLVAVSRTCDYHHHWQDVLVGSVIGLCVAYAVYRQYYPSIFSHNCHRAYPRGSYARSRSGTYTLLRGDGDAATTCTNAVAEEETEADTDTVAKDERRPLICDSKSDNNKWI